MNCTSRYSATLMPDGRTIMLGKQPKIFLEHINDNFFIQVIMELVGEGVLLDLIFMSKSLI